MCISLHWSLYSAIPLGPAQVLPSPSRSLLRHLFDSPVCAYLLSHFWFPWFLILCDPMNHSPPGSSVHGDSPGKNIGLGSHSLLQGIFPTQGLSLCLWHCRQILYWLNHWGSPWWPCRGTCSRSYHIQGLIYFIPEVWISVKGPRCQGNTGCRVRCLKIEVNSRIFFAYLSLCT